MAFWLNTILRGGLLVLFLTPPNILISAAMLTLFRQLNKRIWRSTPYLIVPNNYIPKKVYDM